MILTLCIIFYIAISIFSFGYRYATYDGDIVDPGGVLPPLFWPIWLPIKFAYPIIIKPLFNFGSYIGEKSLKSQQKRIEIKKQKLYEQQKLRVELERIEKDLDTELASQQENCYAKHF